MSRQDVNLFIVNVIFWIILYGWSLLYIYAGYLVVRYYDFKNRDWRDRDPRRFGGFSFAQSAFNFNILTGSAWGAATLLYLWYTSLPTTIAR